MICFFFSSLFEIKLPVGLGEHVPAVEEVLSYFNGNIKTIEKYSITGKVLH